MHIVVRTIVCFFVVLTGCGEPGSRSATAPDVTSDQLVVGESQVSNGELSVTSGNVIMREGETGTVFACVTRPGQAKEIAYFLVFHHDFPKSVVDSHSNTDGLAANSAHRLSAFGVESEVEYRIALKPDSTDIDAESIVIVEATYDPSNGKLFLIDLQESPPQVTQLDVPLPSAVPDLTQTHDAAAFAVDTVNRLRTADDLVDEFCSRASPNSS